MWADDALTCTKIVLNGNLLGGGCPFSLPVSGVVINRSPFAGGFAAMPHGRVSMALTVMRALLAVLFSVGDAVGSWALLIAVCTTAALQLALLLRYLPYYDPQCNAMHGALATLYTWATVCTVIAKVCSLHSTRLVPYLSVLCWTQAFVLLFHTLGARGSSSSSHQSRSACCQDGPWRWRCSSSGSSSSHTRSHRCRPSPG